MDSLGVRAVERVVVRFVVRVDVVRVDGVRVDGVRVDGVRVDGVRVLRFTWERTTSLTMRPREVSRRSCHEALQIPFRLCRRLRRSAPVSHSGRR